ncbi:hypothetical protein JL721_11260 [Aureococcus anophagefferens]|nr:hypothetical protein JL721_11260 [Aureococcus anophagefferens]
MPTARPALFCSRRSAATPFHARPVAVRRPTARRSSRSPTRPTTYEENLWLDDGDEEALTFGNEQLTLSGEGNAFGDSTVADAFALLEAVTSLDAAEVEAVVADLAGRRPARRRWPRSSPRASTRASGSHGVETQLRREQYEALRSRFASRPTPDPPTRSTGRRLQALDETAEPLDPEARKMPGTSDADRPTYQDGA